jgi:hypothetical protein
MGSPSYRYERVVNGLKLWGKWVVANAVGELLGLGTVAIVGLSCTVCWRWYRREDGAPGAVSCIGYICQDRLCQDALFSHPGTLMELTGFVYLLSNPAMRPKYSEATVSSYPKV